MRPTRRQIIKGAAAAGAVTVLPFAARAAGHGGDAFAAEGGDVVVHPISHASFVMETPAGVIYVDPVGEPGQYGGLPPADMILVTHQHGDHFKPETLAALKGGETQMITNPAVSEMLPDELKANTGRLANGDSTDWNGVGIAAIPAYNLTEDRKKFHPQGRDNGYVLNLPGLRVYVSGDTEDIPDMRALTGIDLAFVCMNLPFTMDVAAAASAVNEFKPTYCYPYHYRGRDGGTQDPAAFAELVDGVDVRMGDWYGG